MSIALHFAPSQAKAQLPPAKYTSLTVAVSRVLSHTLSLPDSQLDIAWARSFVCVYAHDAARHLLQALHSDRGGGGGSDEAEEQQQQQQQQQSVEERFIHAATLQLARRIIARARDGLSVSALVDLATVYGAERTTTVQTLFTESLRPTPTPAPTPAPVLQQQQEEEFRTDVLPAFAAALLRRTAAAPDRRRCAYVLSQLVHCAREVALLFAEDGAFLVDLARSYQAGLDDDDDIAGSRGGGGVALFDGQRGMEPWQKDWLYTKTGLLDAFHAMVQALLRSPLPRHTDHLFDILFAMLDLPPPPSPSSSSSPSSAPRIPFVSQPLLADYQFAFDLAQSLSERFGSADDARVDLLVTMLNGLSPSPARQGPKPAGVLLTLLNERARSRNNNNNNNNNKVVAPPVVVDVKGKGKAVEQEDPEVEAPFDLAVSQVLDIFPAETAQHIRRCLRHRAFDGDAERLISALLEGTVPAELADDYEDGGGGGLTPEEELPPRAEEEFEFTKNRRNVWDDDAMDFSKLRVGKARNDADALLQDRSFVEEMKAEIIRRVQELSDEDDEDEEEAAIGGGAQEGRATVVVVDEEGDDPDGDDLEALVSTRVKVAGDGEDTGEEDTDDDDEGTLEDPAANSPEKILELAYMDNPKQFDRDAATRRSKARSDLKARTGWGDEQIEGWRIMLERNPKKDKKKKILQKHEFAGNLPLVPNNTNVLAPGPSGVPQGPEPSSRGHNGRGGGRGGVKRGGRGGRGGGGGGGEGGGEGGTTPRDRAWKDKNKARQANHNRKRGHDRKVARGTGSAPV